MQAVSIALRTRGASDGSTPFTTLETMALTAAYTDALTSCHVFPNTSRDVFSPLYVDLDGLCDDAAVRFYSSHDDGIPLRTLIPIGSAGPSAAQKLQVTARQPPPAAFSASIDAKSRQIRATLHPYHPRAVNCSFCSALRAQLTV